MTPRARFTGMAKLMPSTLISPLLFLPSTAVLMPINSPRVLIIAHEVMHGVVALRLGDDTAPRAGRLTLNPISHVDFFGTIILPFALYLFGMPVLGYAKPVPVNFRVLRGTGLA